MPKLVELRIEKFRRFDEELTLSLRSPAGDPLSFVVVAGPNGCGKTTILESILLVLVRESMIVRDLPATDREKSPRIQLGPDTRLRATFQLRDPKKSISIERSNSLFQVEYGSDRYEGVKAKAFLDGLAIPIEYISSRRLPALVGAIEQTPKGRPPDDTEANRLWLLKYRILQQQGRRGNPRYSGPKPLDQHWLGQLTEFWRQFRNDGTELSLDVVDPQNLDQTDWDLFLFQGSTRICALDALSSGELEVLSMVAPFLTLPEAFDGILLVDEPELHMHPQWQGRVLRALRSVLPEAQIIIASHAQEPWDDALSWQRFLLVPDDAPRSEAWRAKHGGSA